MATKSAEPALSGPAAQSPSDLVCRTPVSVLDAGRTTDVIRELRGHIARLERPGAPNTRAKVMVAFGAPSIDSHVPEGGMLRGALHEVTGAGPDTEHGAAAGLFVAGILARLPGMVLWAVERHDLFAPALAGVGLHPDRVLYAEAGKPRSVLLVMEEGLRHGGLAAVVGEVGGRLGLTASRRLQLAAEASGVMAVALRRSRRFDDPMLCEPSAAATRWRVAALPSEAAPASRAALASSRAEPPDAAGRLGRAHWRLDLLRCRGGEPRSWIVEACDAKGRLGVVADMAGRSVAPQQRVAAA